jgi:Ca-activated chloride channel family protein
MMRFSRALIAFSLIASVVILATSPAFVAGESEPQGKVTPQMVLLHVRVVDSNDNPVTDVPQTSFQLTEDGVPQKIELFMDQEVPLTYGVAIDGSGSIRSQIRDVLGAAINIVNANKPDDETFLVRFISSDKIETLQTLTSDKGLLLDAIAGFYIEGGQTAVIDAVYLSADYLAKQMTEARRLRRRALILVSDGEDRLSYYKQEALLQFLASTDTQIFTIALTKELKGKSREKAVKLLNQLGRDTGGRTYFPSSPGDVQRISNQIIKDIRTQYVIGYVPSAGDASKAFHKVEVSIAEGPNQEKRAAITRVGYQNAK